MLSKEEYVIVQKDPLCKDMILTRGIKPGEQIDFSEYLYPLVIKGDIGEGATVKAKYNITVEGNIGIGSTVHAANGFVVAKDVYDRVKILSANTIQICSVGNEVILEARNNIKASNVGGYCKLTSTQGEVRTDNIGEYTVIKASHSVFTKNVAEHACITSEKSEIFLGDVGAHAEITAFLNISFKSIHALTKTTSTNGELREQLDFNGRAFKTYTPDLKPKLSIDSSSFFHHKESSGKVSTVVINANIETLSINVGAVDSKIFSDFFVQERKSKANISITDNKDTVEYKIEGQNNL